MRVGSLRVSSASMPRRRSCRSEYPCRDNRRRLFHFTGLSRRSTFTSARTFELDALFKSSFKILSGGFDGSLTVIDAGVGVGAGDFGKEDGFGHANSNVVWERNQAHTDKVAAARFGRNGTGFVSSGTDRVVKAWTLETPSLEEA